MSVYDDIFSEVSKPTGKKQKSPYDDVFNEVSDELSRPAQKEAGPMRQPPQLPKAPIDGAFMAGIGQAFNNAGLGIKQALDYPATALERTFGGQKLSNSLGMPTAQQSAANTQAAINQAKIDDASLLADKKGLAGSIVGNIAAFAPTMAIPGAGLYKGAAAIGAGQGALQPVAEGDSRAQNTLLGAAGGTVGKAIVSGLGRVIEPVKSTLSAEVQRLAQVAKDSGINLDLAQLTGSKPLQIAKSVLSNLPLSAGKAADQQAAQQTAFNRAVMAKTGQVADNAAPDVIAAAEKRIGGAIGDSVAGQRISLGPEFKNSLTAVQKEYGNVMEPLQRAEVDRIISLFPAGNNVQMKGEAYQAARSMLGQKASAAYKNDPYAGRAYQGIQAALDDAAQSSLPADLAKALSTARSQYGPLLAIEKTMSKTGGSSGDISGAGLRASVASQNPKSFTRGDGALNDLARVGEQFIKEPIKDSGSAGRIAMQNLLTGNVGALSAGALAGGAGYAGGGDPQTIGLLAATGLLGPAAAQSVLGSNVFRNYALAGPTRKALAQQVEKVLPYLSVPGSTAGLLEYSR